MKQLNTLPIEMYLEKARIAQKSNQKSLTLTIDEAKQLEDSLAVVMTRLAGELDQIAQNVQQSGSVEVKMDGGGF
jgi:hypothetical protein